MGIHAHFILLGVAMFWCLERPSYSVGLQTCLRVVDGIHLAGYQVQVDVSDGCCGCALKQGSMLWELVVSV